jgi:5-(carboxyamino)imidazole ribonucleotide synthase
MMIVPPSCIGIMGGGQLARMLAISARQMGYQVAILEPSDNSPAQPFANYQIKTKYNDQAGLDQLAAVSSVITTEFENVPASSMEYLAKTVPVYPNHTAISICQNRIAEKDFFNANSISTTQYTAIANLTDIDNIDTDLFPAILKTNTLGYDGKGQILVNNTSELKDAFNKLNNQSCILEKMASLKQEVSIMVARSHNEIVCYPAVENIHKNGILDITLAPAKIDQYLEQKIIQAATNIVQSLNYIGILGIELFITDDHKILANEMAPRPHNSGHYTLDACITSQFEQQLRAICNLKLGNNYMHSNAIMLNLLGDIWINSNQPPDWQQILGQYDNVKLHLYDKISARHGRKMGHLTSLGDNLDALYTQALEIKKILNK